MTSTTANDATELAQRSSGGVDVSLLWFRIDGHDRALVCVCDQRERAYFEIPSEPHLALDVFYHPFFYRDFSSVDSRTPACSPAALRREEVRCELGRTRH